MTTHRFPALYQIDTRVTLTGISRQRQCPATLDDLPDASLDWLRDHGFDWVWMLGVWQTGPASRRVSLKNAEWRREFEHTLPDFREADVSGSPFAVQSYTVHRDFGGASALARLRERLHARGLRLLLDFVPNHTALDHEWVHQHPEFYVHGTEEQLRQQPQNYTAVPGVHGPEIFAHGRDPYFPGWADTLQLNYAEPALREAMRRVLLQIAGQCDGVRCDMAMLLLPDVFQHTWGLETASFWPAVVEQVRAVHPQFLFMAEVYWGRERELQQQGFDYTYDKQLYDRLRKQRARPVREHFQVDAEYQRKSVRFLENHDERRAAAVFPPGVHEAAAVLTYLCPGMRLLHQGQLDGYQTHISPHLARGPMEPSNPEIHLFYERLLACMRRPVTQAGEWKLLGNAPAWEGNWTDGNFICWQWCSEKEDSLLVCVNYSAYQSQCYLRIAAIAEESAAIVLQDCLHLVTYTRNSEELRQRGLYLDLPAWGYHVFEMRPATPGVRQD